MAPIVWIWFGGYGYHVRQSSYVIWSYVYERGELWGCVVEMQGCICPARNIRCTPAYIHNNCAIYPAYRVHVQAQSTLTVASVHANINAQWSATCVDDNLCCRPITLYCVSGQREIYSNAFERFRCGQFGGSLWACGRIVLDNAGPGGTVNQGYPF